MVGFCRSTYFQASQEVSAIKLAQCNIVSCGFSRFLEKLISVMTFLMALICKPTCGTCEPHLFNITR